MKKVSIILGGLVFALSSCGGGETLPEAKSCGYKYDNLKSKVTWSGFKTSEKVKVSGEFVNFTTSSDGKVFDTISDIIDGATFKIDVASSASGDEARDANLKDAFFSILASDLSIDGRFEDVQDGKIVCYFNLADGEKKTVLNYTQEDSRIVLTGGFDLITDLQADSAYNSIHQKCESLHTGADGVSKTWSEVEVNVSIPFESTCK